MWSPLFLISRFLSVMRVINFLVFVSLFTLLFITPLKEYINWFKHSYLLKRKFFFFISQNL